MVNEGSDCKMIFDIFLVHKNMKERKERKIERQKDRKIERQKDRKKESL